MAISKNQPMRPAEIDLIDIINDNINDDGTFKVDLTESYTGTVIEAGNVCFLESLEVDGKAIQDDTPTPSEPVPIEVVEGRNLFSAPIDAYITASSGNVTVNDGNGKGTLFVSKIEQNASYTISAKHYSDMTRFRVTLFDADPREQLGTAFMPEHYTNIVTTSDPATNQSITFDSGTFTYAALALSTGTTTYHADAEAQCEVGSTATPYVPYGSIGLLVGDSVTPIDLQGNVLASLPDGTRDTLTVDSAGHCVLVKRIEKTSMNSLTWSMSSNASIFYASITDMRLVNSGISSLCGAYGAHAAIQNAGAAVSALSDKQQAVSYGTSTPYVYLRDNDYTTQADFRTAVSNGTIPNADIYYPLATPKTIDLGYIDMPAVEDNDEISILASITPKITVTCWKEFSRKIAEAIQNIKNMIYYLQPSE